MNLGRIACVLLGLMATASACVTQGQHSQTARTVSASNQVEAAHAFDLGVQAYARGDVASALGYFDRANSIAPSPVVLFNLARVHDALGHDLLAARDYIAYLHIATNVPGDLSPRDTAQSLSRLVSRVGWIIVRAPAENRITVDNDIIPSVPSGYALAVATGMHAIRISSHPDVAVVLHPGEIIGIDFVSMGRGILVENETIEHWRQVAGVQPDH